MPTLIPSSVDFAHDADRMALCLPTNVQQAAAGQSFLHTSVKYAATSTASLSMRAVAVDADSYYSLIPKFLQDIGKEFIKELAA